MADTPTHEPLKPCPFCGSDKIEKDSGDESTHYRCRNCGASSGRVYFSAGEREAEDYSLSEGIALEAWNCRAALAAADAALSVPAGWVLVPVKPSLRQMAAMGPAIRACYGLDGDHGTVRDVYAAAIAATPQPPAPVPAAPPNAAELDRLRAALDKWETALSAVMPADYKAWHESDRAAWPDLAASCIVNARRMAEADGVLINAMDAWRAAVEAELNAIHDTADNHPTPKAAIRALIDWHCAVQIDPAVSSDAAALVERGRREALGTAHE